MMWLNKVVVALCLLIIKVRSESCNLKATPNKNNLQISIPVPLDLSDIQRRDPKKYICSEQSTLEKVLEKVIRLEKFVERLSEKGKTTDESLKKIIKLLRMPQIAGDDPNTVKPKTSKPPGPTTRKPYPTRRPPATRKPTTPEPTTTTEFLPTLRDCLDKRNLNDEAIISVGTMKHKVKCEAGWTIMLNRYDGSQDFKKIWKFYKEGFGDVHKEHYVGNEFLHQITTRRKYKLRVEMSDFHGNNLYAEYKDFSLASESDNYKLAIGVYSGNAGDALGDPSFGSNGMNFSTVYRDNDPSKRMHCARGFNGGWWFNQCFVGFLTGPYSATENCRTPSVCGMTWRTWPGKLKNSFGHHSGMFALKTAKMKIMQQK